MSNEIQLNPDVNGINFGGKNLKRTMFADNATFVTDGSQKSFQTLVHILNNFSYISGLNLNIKKCTVLRAGSLTHTEIRYMGEKNSIGPLSTQKPLV